MIYAIIVACIFIATSLSFVLYDYLITHEQNRLTRLALKSSRIVDSLFPAVVRKRLFGDEVGEATAMAGGSEAGGSTTEKLRRFMHGNTKNMSKKKNELPGSNMGSVESEYSLSNEVLSSPIADKYEGTTVLFADLAGFTAWSSGRPADHVFLLLESLYREFDRLALELGIFKVETIGDCYMAVCGVPDPREDHALAMAKFAMGMQLEMIKVQKHLVLRLGDNVMDLKLRCGFHSGPVTAGVVRGQRARFQLFGDTVNTASRMESTGRPGAVQISTTSFDQLKAAGKEEWCRAREDVVEAKGKGRLQTYWLVGDAAHQAAFTAASTRQDEFVTSVAPPLPDGAGLGIMTV
jgi:class 3 adenylate cyclase